MSKHVAGGRRRLDHVLDPQFVRDLDTHSVDQLRERHTQASQESADLSAARQLVQARLDLLIAERDARAQGGGRIVEPRSDSDLAHDIAHALQDRGVPQQVSPHQRHQPIEANIEAPVDGEHQREAERAIQDVGISWPNTLSDNDLTQAIDHLRELETQISMTRSRVHAVVDTLGETLAHAVKS